jgi:hypothetical protein
MLRLSNQHRKPLTRKRPTTKSFTHKTPIMPLTYRILHFIFLQHRPTAREQASARVASSITHLKKQHTADVRAAMQLLIRELRGDNAAVWTCHCCQYRNDVAILGGEHPLGVLKCEYCEHVYCTECAHEGSVMRWRVEGKTEEKDKEKGDEDGRGERSSLRELPYVSICGGCGLSWRAKVIGMRKVRWGFARKECVCGCRPRASRSWAGFKIKEGEIVEKRTRTLLCLLREELADR